MSSWESVSLTPLLIPAGPALQQMPHTAQGSMVSPDKPPWTQQVALTEGLALLPPPEAEGESWKGNGQGLFLHGPPCIQIHQGEHKHWEDVPLNNANFLLL